MEQFYPSLVPNFTCLVHGIHFSKTFPKVLNYYETRWSYSSEFFEKKLRFGPKRNSFTQFGSKTSSTLFLEYTLTILSAILQDYNLMCKRKWQKCTYNPLETHIGPKIYTFSPQFGSKNFCTILTGSAQIISPNFYRIKDTKNKRKWQLLNLDSKSCHMHVLRIYSKDFSEILKDDVI